MSLDVTVSSPKKLTGLTYQPVEQFQYNYDAPDLSTTIAEKVEVAVSNAMVPYLEQLVQNTKDVLSKEIAVNIGDKEIARANIRGKQEMGMRLIT